MAKRTLLLLQLATLIVLSGACHDVRPPQDEQHIALEGNRALVRRWIEVGFNGKDLRVVDDLFAEQFVVNEQPIGREALKQNMTRRFTAFPDLRVSIVETLAEGDKVGLWYTAQGTQNGEFEGVRPTNRQISWSGCDLLRIEGNKIAEGWFLDDSLGLLRQLGGPVK